jgi:transcriptional regulator with XRE-family HTH domain
MAQLRFGPRTKKARVRLGLTQAELGSKFDPKVSHSLISLWENEKSYPTDDQKDQVRHFFGQMVNETGSMSGADDSEEGDVLNIPSAIGVWLTKARVAAGLSVPELAEKSSLSGVSLYNIESGRAQNPQRATIEKLEKALGQNLSAEAKEVAKEEATIEGVGEWFNFNPNSPAEWPSGAGIYVLYDISDRPIYVGQGQKISARLRDHHEKFWFRAPIVQNAAYVGVESKQLREQIEKVLIKFLKSNAVLNQQNVDR